MAGPFLDSRDTSGSDLISALRLSQQAPTILRHDLGSGTKSLSAPDTAEEYGRIERLFMACLRTGDDESAEACLNRLTRRFGPANERVMGLRGLYEEAIAKDHSALEECLQGYEKTLSDNPVNVVSMEFPGLQNLRLTGCEAYFEAPSGSIALAQQVLRCDHRADPAPRCHSYRCGSLV